MKLYEVITKNEKYHIEADDIEFRDDFYRVSTQEPLVFHREKRLMAVFKEWESIIDISERFTE